MFLISLEAAGIGGVESTECLEETSAPTNGALLLTPALHRPRVHFKDSLTVSLAGGDGGFLSAFKVLS